MKDNSLNKIAWRKLKNDKLAFYSLIFILLLSFIGVFPYLFMTDKTEYANQMNLELSTLKPMSKISVLIIEGEKIFATDIFEESWGVTYNEFSTSEYVEYEGDYDIDTNTYFFDYYIFTVLNECNIGLAWT